MALFDVMFELFDSAALLADGATDYIGTTCRVIDFQTADTEMGQGTPLWLNIRVAVAYAGGTTADFQLWADDELAGHNSDSTPVLASGPIKTADIDAVGDWILRAPLPVDVNPERYLSLGVTCVGTYTAGSINAWLDLGPQSSHNVQVSASNI